VWVQRQREKGVFRRMMEVINEPRFKFYVKEGRLYTMKTGVPGVWEEVARRIQEQTADETEKMKHVRKRLGMLARWEPGWGSCLSGQRSPGLF
jgi:hypothetical protein